MQLKNQGLRFVWDLTSSYEVKVVPKQGPVLFTFPRLAYASLLMWLP